MKGNSGDSMQPGTSSMRRRQTRRHGKTAKKPFKAFQPFKWFGQLTMSGISTAALRSSRLNPDLVQEFKGSTTKLVQNVTG